MYLEDHSKMTNASTKRSVLTFAGVVMFGFGLVLVYVGHIYYALLSLLPEIERASALFAGIILVVCGARNVTFGFGSFRSNDSCCGPGCCQAVVVNLLALLMGLGCIGVPIWTSWNKLTADNVDLRAEPELVYLIAILFSGVVVVIASIAGIFVGFLPSNSSSREEDHEMSSFPRQNTHAY